MTCKPGSTTHIRINKRLKMELKNNFPNVREAELINVMYRTSALRPEIWLRKPNKLLNKMFRGKRVKK